MSAARRIDVANDEPLTEAELEFADALADLIVADIAANPEQWGIDPALLAPGVAAPASPPSHRRS